MTNKEKFLASAGIREKPFEVEFNGAKLSGIVRIHGAKKYREIIKSFFDENGMTVMAEQFLNIEDRTPIFSADEMDAVLPDALFEKLSAVFIEANTGRNPEESKKK